jgi:hypothetical protein
MKHFLNLRTALYSDVYDRTLKYFGQDLRYWNNNAYSKLKSYIYIELACIISFICIKTGVKPNNITLAYAASGILGSLLIVSGTNSCVVAGAIIFFCKSSLDWADGFVARQTKQTSTLGDALDCWGAQVNSMFFMLGFFVYLYQACGEVRYLIVLILIVTLRACIFRPDVKNHKELDTLSPHSTLDGSGKNFFLKGFIKNILKFSYFDGSSKQMDFAILLLILELLINFNLMPYLAYIWLIGTVLRFLHPIIVVAFGPIKFKL